MTIIRTAAEQPHGAPPQADWMPVFAAAVHHHRAGNLAQAITLYGRVIVLRPGFAEVRNHLGAALLAQGQPHQAAVCFLDAMRLRPDFAEACHNLALALLRLGRLAEAIACGRRAIALAPDDPVAHTTLGNALVEQGAFEPARASYERAIALRPDYAEAHNNLGNTLLELGALDEACAALRRALALRPDYAEAHNNLGNALLEQRRLDEAGAALHRALDLQPDFPAALNNLGNLLRDQRCLDQALSCYDRAIALQPDFAEAQTHRAMTLLAKGAMAEGWAAFEWRWKTRRMADARRPFVQPQWRGEQARGQRLLIHAEQGFGDTLQFCRYATIAAGRGLCVILQVPAPLSRLLRCLPGVDRVLTEDEDPPAFDLHCPMLSLPLAMNTTLETIPARDAYLHPDPAEQSAWRARLAADLGPGPRIGLAWAGNPRRHSPALAAIDQRRSIAPDQLAKLFTVPGMQFVSLQKHGPKAGAHLPMLDPMAECVDFAATAALVANLDLVISVDTAIAHLAAALGRPVWLLDRFDACWRWLTDRRDSPWYPSLRLYRQAQPGDWDAVVADVTDDLRRLALEPAA